ncbi:MAG: quinone-dependent dihydroorotate dehydrogenase [Bacteroidales bacterium]
MYKSLIRPILFKFAPEQIHNFVFTCFKIAKCLPGAGFLVRKLFRVHHPVLEKELFGLKFPNPVGLAAGLDKDAIVFDMLGNLGFGFVEIGTLTPIAQPGNPKPRLFRLKKDKALINRMGFNNQGVENAIRKLKKKKSNLIIGGNIGKNKNTPNEKAIDDYIVAYNALYPYVDYFAINISSPNTPNLRELQEKEPLKKLLETLRDLNIAMPKPKPVLLKIAPDLTFGQIDDIIEIVQQTSTSGIIATNTTITRENLSYSNAEVESFGTGGLSGQPLKNKSTEIIRYIVKKSGNKIPVIGVGGIMSASDAIEKLEAGASLVQIYTGFIYEGPALIKEINKLLIKKAESSKS